MQLAKVIRSTTVAILLLTVCSIIASAADSKLKLTYDKPAAKWTEALPLGNGRIGAMVFGGTDAERIQINEGTLWGGAPSNYQNPEAGKALAEVRKLIFAGKIDEAQKLVNEKMMGNPKLLMPYQPFCDLRLDFPGHSAAQEYRRELRLDDAVSTVSYKFNGVTYRREVFVSYPDQVLVMRLTADQPGKQSFTVKMNSPHQGTKVQAAVNNTIQLSGQIQPKENPAHTWTGSWSQPGMRFAAVLKVVADGGSVRKASDSLEVVSANSVTILFSNATSFRTYTDLNGDPEGLVAQYLDGAAAHKYDDLRSRHVKDYQKLFSRVRLQLGSGVAANTNTDERIRNFSKGNDLELAVLYYQFGRYLMISSSRPGGQPANLQGLWNQDVTPPWGSKWTTNINLQMNYWPAETGDLWESEEPLWNLVLDFQLAGAQTARTYYNSPGWVLHHNSDLWRATTPVDGHWGLWPMGEAWLANQMWDHYEFSQDTNYLRDKAYPAMRGAAEFILGTLVEAPAGTKFAGRLVTNPSTSPENEYLLNGKRASLTYAATMDLELITELFENCRKAAQILKTDKQFSAQLETAQKRLPPLQIGSRGQLQEWIEDYSEPEPEHRHTSHLYALYPGRGISPDTTPDLAAAARKTLELRGDGGTGWAKAWKIAEWARLRDGDHAYKLFQSLISESTLPNMFDTHPPFQIDGNFGAAAAIAEMLVQSGDGEVIFLPALPSAWPDGKVEGLRARGGAKVDVEWRQGKLVSASVRSNVTGPLRLRYENKMIELQLRPGTPVQIDHDLKRAAK